jgi:hypothetical protein
MMRNTLLPLASNDCGKTKQPVGRSQEMFGVFQRPMAMIPAIAAHSGRQEIADG